MTAESTTPLSSSAVSHSTAALAGFDDELLAQWLKTQNKIQSDVVLVYAGTTCKVYAKADPRSILYSVDPESKAKAAFKALAKKDKLYSVQVSPSDISCASTADSSWLLEKKSVQDIEVLLEQRKSRLGRVDGRGDAISVETANKVWADAGGCCMFKGCAQDLSNVPLYNKSRRIAYLAHIIASDPDGPRGTDEESHLLSNHPENIMLMCDAHHRLIDSFEPGIYKAPRLQEMRRVHSSKVRMYRDAMRFPEAQVMTLFADLGNIPTHFPDSEFVEALLAEEMSMHPEVKRHITFRARDDRTPPDFWGNYLREMELAIGNMVQDLRRPSFANSLAVFPVHHTPTLILAGRIVGEARQVEVFQRSRQRKSWLWNVNAAARSANSFSVSGLSDIQVDEVIFTVELSANIDENTLPLRLYQQFAAGQMPWIRLTTDDPNPECIQRKEDLSQFIHAARSAVNSIQDMMRAKRVHLIVVSPASATFSVGQLLQAGHHSVFTIYDRPNGQQLFREAFTLNGYSVLPPAGSAHYPLSIR